MENNSRLAEPFASAGSADQYLISDASSSLIINGAGSLGTLYFDPSANLIGTAASEQLGR